MVELVNKAQQQIAPGPLVSGAPLRPRLALQQDLSLRGLIQTAHQMHQGAFARTRSTHNGDRFTCGHREVHTLQHRDIQTAFGKAFA